MRYCFRLSTILVIILLITNLSISNSYAQDKRLSKAPVYFNPMNLGFNAMKIEKVWNDTITYIFSPFVSYDKSTTVDKIYAIMEVYNDEDSLIIRKEQSIKDNNKLKLVLHISPLIYDYYLINAWAYMLDSTIDSTQKIDKKKLIFNATRLFQDTVIVKRKKTIK